MKKCLLIIISAILILSLSSGCGVNALPTSTATATGTMPSQEATPGISVSPSGEVTVSPSPSATESAVETSQPVENWPIVDGLTIKNGVYYYEAGNPYGGEVGKEAGVVRENVYVEEEKVGGICFAAEVCQKLLQDELAKIPEGQDKLKVIVPLDISGYDGKVDISNCDLVVNEDYTYHSLKIDCSAEIPIVSLAPGPASLDAGALVLEDNRILRSIFMPNDQNKDISSFEIIVNSTGSDFNDKVSYKDIFFGKQLLVKNADSEIYILSDFTNSSGMISLNPFYLLEKNGVVVFIIAEENKTS